MYRQSDMIKKFEIKNQNYLYKLYNNRHVQTCRKGKKY